MLPPKLKLNLEKSGIHVASSSEQVTEAVRNRNVVIEARKGDISIVTSYILRIMPFLVYLPDNFVRAVVAYLSHKKGISEETSNFYLSAMNLMEETHLTEGALFPILFILHENLTSLSSISLNKKSAFLTWLINRLVFIRLSSPLKVGILLGYVEEEQYKEFYTKISPSFCFNKSSAIAVLSVGSLQPFTTYVRVISDSINKLSEYPKRLFVIVGIGKKALSYALRAIRLLQLHEMLRYIIFTTTKTKGKSIAFHIFISNVSITRPKTVTKQKEVNIQIEEIDKTSDETSDKLMSTARLELKREELVLVSIMPKDDKEN